jgi:hypothetical protein
MPPHKSFFIEWDGKYVNDYVNAETHRTSLFSQRLKLFGDGDSLGDLINE